VPFFRGYRERGEESISNYSEWRVQVFRLRKVGSRTAGKRRPYRWLSWYRPARGKNARAVKISVRRAGPSAFAEAMADHRSLARRWSGPAAWDGL